MSERTVELIIANAISELARGDPDALAPHTWPLWRRPDTASLQERRMPLSVLSHLTS